MLKHPNGSGGLYKDYFNTFSFILIGVFNVVNISFNNGGINEYLQVIPFFAVAVLIYISKTSKPTKYIVFTMVGIIYQFYVPDTSYIGAVTFYSLAFMQIPCNESAVFISIITIVSIVIKSSLLKELPSKIMLPLILIVMVFGNVYLLYLEYKREIERLKLKHKEEIESVKRRYEEEIESLKEERDKALNGEIQPIKNIDIINITQEEKGILRYFCKSYDYDKIQQLMGLNISPNTVRRKITSIKKENKDRILRGRKDVVNINDAHFGTWLNEKV